MLFDTILEGAVRVLEESGLEEFNTRTVADRSGVSVGSVYQYFGSIDAIMAEIVLGEHKRILSILEAAIESMSTLSFEEATRRMIRQTSENAPSRKIYRIIEAAEERLPRTDELADTEAKIVEYNRMFFSHYLSPHLSEDRIKIAALDIFKIVRALHDGPQPTLDENDPDALPNRVLRAVYGYVSQLGNE